MVRFICGMWLVLGIGLCISCSPYQVEAKDHMPPGTLTAAELEKLVPDTTAEVIFGKSQRGLAYFGPNGDFQLVKRERLKTGSWKIKKNGRLCTQLGDAKWDCRILVRSSPEYKQYVVKKSGDHKYELTYQQFHPGRQLTKLLRSPILPEGTLTRKELEELFSDRTVESMTVKKNRLSMSYYDPSGTVEQLRNGVTRTGTWRVTKKDRICLTMENSREKCRIVVKEGGQYNKYIVKKSGEHQHSVTYVNFFSGKMF